jgi:hypothetical protein
MDNRKKAKIAKQARNNNIHQLNDAFTDRISLEEMRKLWNDEQGTLSDDDLIRVRDWVYVITGIIIRTVTALEKQTPIISLQPQTNENSESNPLCESEYRRTG